MPFLPPNQQYQSTEGREIVINGDGDVDGGSLLANSKPKSISQLAWCKGWQPSVTQFAFIK